MRRQLAGSDPSAEPLMRRIGASCRLAGGTLRDFVRGCAGLDDYGRYLVHHRRVHPDDPPLAFEAFFRRKSAARWDGVRRCC